jgi:glyceraldehyde-3-phosphate dehydrogenase/erythrose-4-phosphate dehydrogenase
MSKVRVAVVGVGAFGKNHARVLAQADEAELVAVADSDPGRAAAVARSPKRCSRAGWMYWWRSRSRRISRRRIG